ncbi:hypothetical protein ETB97_010466 [Aspergillus alliaceus]|uniref:Uncharacterized protein n=1 Tax=Petromyces alliaceus TaxID=209559 RepID=A0A8H6E962_PETAA|nr:hypothetical protein ETB97_010466 [Aspergillus burnettii]
MTNPAVVICHGSYHSPAPYEPFIRHLQSQGFESYCPHRPTCNLSELNVGDVEHPDLDQEPPLGGYPSDTADVDEVIQLPDRLVNQNGKRVLLAAVPELQAKSRQTEGRAGGEEYSTWEPSSSRWASLFLASFNPKTPPSLPRRTCDFINTVSGASGLLLTPLDFSSMTSTPIQR